MFLILNEHTLKKTFNYDAVNVHLAIKDALFQVSLVRLMDPWGWLDFGGMIAAVETLNIRKLQIFIVKYGLNFIFQ
jgi:hypothetical protein